MGQGDISKGDIRMAKIVRIQIAKAPGRWNQYRVREITAGGRVLNSYLANGSDNARRIASSSARAHGVGTVERVS